MIKAFLDKIKDKLLFRFLFVFILSMVFGIITLWIAKSFSFFKSDKTKPDFFMNKYYSQRNNNTQDDWPPYNKIYLLEAGSLKREDMAKMLVELHSMHPKVIGLDILHVNPEYPKSDSMLIQALKKCQSELVLPVVINSDGDTIAAPFYSKSFGNVSFGSIAFDQPWYNKTKHGNCPTFAYQVSKKYCNVDVDTISFLVDYTPMSLTARIQYDTSNHVFTWVDNGKPGAENINLKNAIVLIGTTNRAVDAIYLDFPVAFESKKTHRIIPGMVALSYQIRSFLDKQFQINKMNRFGNLVCCILGLSIYICFSFFLYCLELYCLEKKSNQKSSKNNLFLKKLKSFSWIIFPWIKILALIFAECLVVLLFYGIVSHCKMMPNLWFLMASLPYVNCSDLILSRWLKIDKNNKNEKD